MRTADVEQHGVDRLIEKWGGDVVRPGGVKGKRHSTGRNILNMRVFVPISGC